MKKFVVTLLTKLGLKKTALTLYFFVTNEWFLIVASIRKKIIPIIVSKRSKSGVYAINLNSNWLGLGARIVKTIEILLYCDERNLVPSIRYSYEEKTINTEDYFSELFFNKLIEEKRRKALVHTDIRDVDELGWAESYNLKLRLSTAKQIFEKYLGVNADILEEVKEFVADKFRNKKVLGLHFRGTDKSGEAPRITDEAFLTNIKTIVRENPDLELVFVSSDEAGIIDFLKKSDLLLPIIYRQDIFRSNDGDQFHRKEGNSKSSINRDAIVNMLILSKCDYLLKTASILSDCSVVFNPKIKVKVLNRPHSDELTWWPFREIIQNQN